MKCMKTLWRCLMVISALSLGLTGCAVPHPVLLPAASEPTSPKDHYDRGLAYGRMGQYDKAIEDFSKAIAMDPNYGKAYMNRGIAYAKSGNGKKAAADFAQCCNIGFDEGCEASIQWIMGGPLNFSRE